MSNLLLEINELRIHFRTPDGTAEVVNGVDFTIQQGEVVGLVGESGCGKSVTARSILGLLSDNAEIQGEISFKSQDLLGLSPAEFQKIRGREISMVMQDPMSSLNPVFTVGEQMKDILLYQGKRRVGIRNLVKNRISGSSRMKDDIIEAMDMVNISAPERVFDSYPIELSGGMRQRVLIAMAILSEPDLLILDEPGTALDATTENKIIQLLKTLIEDTGTSAIYITHDLGVTKEICDYVNVMYAGEIVETARVEDLFNSPQHPYTRGLLDCVPQLSKDLESGIPGELPDYTNPPTACRFYDRCEYSSEECDTAYPHPRYTSEDHSVACHLHTGEPVHERHQSHEIIDIGVPPWRTQSGDRGGNNE